jgi:hypothetical protein
MRWTQAAPTRARPRERAAKLQSKSNGLHECIDACSARRRQALLCKSHAFACLIDWHASFWPVTGARTWDLGVGMHAFMAASIHVYNTFVSPPFLRTDHLVIQPTEHNCSTTVKQKTSDGQTVGHQLCPTA